MSKINNQKPSFRSSFASVRTCYTVRFNYNIYNLSKMAFGDVKTEQGLKELNTFLEDKSYISG